MDANEEGAEGVARSYEPVAGIFEVWVRIMEMHTRRKELEETARRASRILIVSPPTDPGIGLLAEANAGGSTELLCLSKRLRRIAEEHGRRRGWQSVAVRTAPFFRLPFGDDELDAIYANCSFDFLPTEEIGQVLAEMARILKPRGQLFTVYMDEPSTLPSRAWAWAFRRFRFVSRGCHPVAPDVHWEQLGFRLKANLALRRFGCPVRYVDAEKIGDR